MESVEAELRGDLVPLLDHAQNVRRVVIERARHPLDVVRERSVPHQNRAERAAESEVVMKDRGHVRQGGGESGVSG